MEEEDVVVSMSLTASRNASGVTPDFVSNALGDVLHRFILVIECENRLYEGDSENSPPRFCVGSDRAIADPRSVAIHELVALGSANVAVPDGWEKAHEFLYGMNRLKPAD